MKILVTGGAGFIGSHIAEAYLKEGFDVIIVDNLATGRLENIPPKAKFYKADICDEKTMEKIFKEERPTVVNHHAAQIKIHLSLKNPVKDAETNILGGLSLLELSRKYAVKKWIFASSGGALYGEVTQGAAKETDPIHPISPYGTSKYCLEKYIELYGRLYSLPYTILRYANVYGPRQIPKAEGGVIAIFIEAMSKGESPTIFGDGYQERDFVYVEDVMNANLKALTQDYLGAVNIGTGQSIRIKGLFELLQKGLKFQENPKFALKRAGEIFRSAVDISLAKRVFHWEPKTSLKEGLQKTIRWAEKGLDKLF